MIGNKRSCWIVYIKEPPSFHTYDIGVSCCSIILVSGCLPIPLSQIWSDGLALFIKILSYKNVNVDSSFSFNFRVRYNHLPLLQVNSIMKNSQGIKIYEVKYHRGIIFLTKSYDDLGNLIILQSYYTNGQVRNRIEYRYMKGKYKRNKIRFDIKGNKLL